MEEKREEFLNDCRVDNAYDEDVTQDIEPNDEENTSEDTISNEESSIEAKEDAKIEDIDTPPAPIEENSIDVAPNDKKDKKKKEKTPKVKKPMTKAKKIVLAVVCILLLAAIIATSIAVPIVVANKDKIFVSSQEDFANKDGSIYVLKKDVVVNGDLKLGSLNNIDLNGKLLTITGSLIIDDKGKKNVNISSSKDSGTIQAGAIVINSKNAVYLNAITKVRSINVDAKEITLNGGTSIKEVAKFNADEVIIKNKLNFTGSDTSKVVDIIDAKNIDLKAKVNGTVRISNVENVNTEGFATIANISNSVSNDVIADSNTKVIINSRVNGVIKNAKLVVLEDKALVTRIEDVDTVYMNEKLNAPYMDGVQTVETIRQLESVGYANVDVINGKILLTISKVTGANVYNISINGHALAPITDDSISPSGISGNLQIDLTASIKGAAKHKISIVASSSTNPDLLRDSKPYVYEYITYMDLATPQGITIDDETKMLSFEAVPFAERYVIKVNGKKFTSMTNSNINLGKYITKGGTYIIEVVATSSNNNIIDSKTAMVKYNNIVNLDKLVLGGGEGNKKVTITSTSTNVKLAWDAIDNASYYEIVLVKGDSESVIYRTPAGSFEADTGYNSKYQIQNGDKFKIRAISNNQYYITSESEEIAYQY